MPIDVDVVNQMIIAGQADIVIKSVQDERPRHMLHVPFTKTLQQSLKQRNKELMDFLMCPVPLPPQEDYKTKYERAVLACNDMEGERNQLSNKLFHLNIENDKVKANLADQLDSKTSLLRELDIANGKLRLIQDAINWTPIPEGVYYNETTQNFYSGTSLMGIGNAFLFEWHPRRSEFPQGLGELPATVDAPTPAITMSPPTDVVDAVIPENVYYSVEIDNFYSLSDGVRGMGTIFYQEWKPRKIEFPQKCTGCGSIVPKVGSNWRCNRCN